ncbi:MAG: isochorismatase family protein [Betaproteobacteria bacterium]|nr:isochorismatase family protein [Betaproteobacteria bacterium]
MIKAPKAGDTLLLVDVQNDFLPGGALAVPDGDAVIPVLNRYVAAALAARVPIYASRDWHPPDHCSFKAQGGPWPPHCMAGTPGAKFAAALDLPAKAEVISKAATTDKDAYSAFEGTGLADDLRGKGVKRLLIGGLATDYCVLNSVRDALKHGFEVLLLTDAIRAVNVKPRDGDEAQAEMLRLGARPVTFGDLNP